MLSKLKYTFQIQLGFFLLFFITTTAVAQHKDSLKIETFNKQLNKISPQEVDSIVILVNENINYFSSPKNEYGLYKVKAQAGYILSRYGYYNLSIAYYLQALKHSEKLSDKKHQVKVLNAIGAYYGRKGDFSNAETYLLKSKLLSNKINDYEGLASAFLKMGALRINQQNAEEALMYLEKIDSLNQHHGTEYYVIDHLANKGIVYAMQGKLDSALNIFNNSYKYAVENKDYINQILAFQNIGLVYKEKGDIDKALKLFSEGISLAEKHNLIENKIKVAVNVPQILMMQRKKAEALRYATNLLAEADKIELEGAAVELNSMIIEIAKSLNDYKAAVIHLEKLNALKTKLNKLEYNKALAEAAAEIDLYKTQRTMKSTIDLLLETRKEKKFILTGFVILIALLIAVVFFLFKIRKLNKQLNKNKTQLVASNNNKNKLFSIIGHDLRTAYSSTLGVLTLIKSGDLDKDEQDKYLDKVMSQSESALATLDDLLLWGHAQIKGRHLSKSKINVHQLTEKNIHFYRDQISSKDIKIMNKIDSDCHVFMDENHFSFIIRNLIANAIKYTPNHGDIQITGSLHNHDFIKICVKDSGVGIPDEKLESIFLAESKSTKGTNNESGTGLGLTLCKEFAESDGGEIWAENIPEGGAKICFTAEKCS